MDLRLRRATCRIIDQVLRVGESWRIHGPRLINRKTRFHGKGETKGLAGRGGTHRLDLHRRSNSHYEAGDASVLFVARSRNIRDTRCAPINLYFLRLFISVFASSLLCGCKLDDSQCDTNINRTDPCEICCALCTLRGGKLLRHFRYRPERLIARNNVRVGHYLLKGYAGKR